MEEMCSGYSERVHGTHPTTSTASVAASVAVVAVVVVAAAAPLCTFASPHALVRALVALGAAVGGRIIQQ